MASTSVAERADIHKSCKAVEGVVNLLNDYCEAATAIVAIQKKLARAMRDVSSIRCTSEIAVNALNACAAVVDALVEVDSKFVKFADKECDSLSADVRKWFKTLAKEERAHDAKLTAANGKIKQAGQIYEKKVKKNPANAAEEHARYMNILGTLGPEVSQEKYQHAMSVFQQHTTLVLGMVVSVCRIADAEWLRACEEVRRVAPGIGSVGEWKALCEGSWTGLIPADLPDVDANHEVEVTRTALKVKMSMNDIKPASKEDALSTPQAATPAPEYASRATTPASPAPPTYFSPKMTSAVVQQPAMDSDDARDRSHSVNSIASLGSFPTPPSHFPIPPVPSLTPMTPTTTNTGSADEQQQQQQQSQQTLLTPTFANSPHASAPATPDGKRRSTPTSTNISDLDTPRTSLPSAPAQHDATFLQKATSTITRPDEQQSQVQSTPISSAQTDKVSSSSSASSSSTSSIIRQSMAYKRGDYIGNEEFGVRKSTKGNSIPEQPLRASSPSTAATDRREMNRSGSIASVMRERFARSTGPASPPPKDIPRLPLSVSNLATRYEAVVETQDPSREAKSPTEERRLSTDVRPLQGQSSPVTQRNVAASPPPQSSYTAATSGPTEGEIARRRQRIRELEELELREQAHEIRLKEREIEQRARELERDKQRLMNARTYRTDSPLLASQKPGSQSTAQLVESPSSSPILGSRQPFPSTHTQPRPQHAPAPSMGHRFPSSQSSASQPSSPSLYHHPSILSDHPDSCGCEICSVSKYNSRPSMSPMASSTSLRPPDSPVLSTSNKTEKPKGWIRRLSMPVMGNAFSSESKKGISSANYVTSGAGGVPYRNSLAVPDEDGRLRRMIADPKNRSVTNLMN